MRARSASEDDTDEIARLVVGDAAQASTVALMRLFDLNQVAEALELTRIMTASTESWRSMVIAEGSDGQPIGLVQVGEAFAALTPEVLEFARRVYGENYQEILGPRLAAMALVQAHYPANCLLVAEIHVDLAHRGMGIGRALLDVAVEQALAEGHNLLGLQTLTNNPSRGAFEAWGFVVTETRTDDEFEKYTGATGYHMMLRQL